ncbi:hypothetical protein [Neisseria sicca]|uniref:hypothetical protein n=1 Tax=Neisseria sicca TaxID=490 RepID=UPI0039891823
MDFAVQFVAFDVGNDFAVEADLVQVSAAVVQVIDMAAVGQDGADGVARCVVVVAGGMAQRIGNGFEIAVFGVTETGGFAGTVGEADELVEGVVV